MSARSAGLVVIALIVSLGVGYSLGAGTPEPVVDLVTVEAQAGYGVDNHYEMTHWQAGFSAPEHFMRLHRGDAGLDTTSPAYDDIARLQLRAVAMVGQAEFDSQATIILGTWYTGQTLARQEQWRALFMKLD